jgi:hypothetical protein
VFRVFINGVSRGDTSDAQLGFTRWHRDFQLRSAGAGQIAMLGVGLLGLGLGRRSLILNLGG